MHMRARIDALGPDRALSNIGTQVLADDEDPVLQRIVQSAAMAVGTPIALVSLVLDNIQLFRAQVGLPEDLARVAATARDISFCQFVVRDDALFEVRDAQDDHRVPQSLVESHGIRAYLGAPIHLGEQPLGSLCVIDTRPRSFTESERAHLKALADEVDARIAEWVHDDRGSDGQAVAIPLLGRMRDELSLLACARDELMIARSELQARQRSVNHGDPAFMSWARNRDRSETISQISVAIDLLERSGDGLLDGVRALETLTEQAASSGSPSRVVQLAAGASELAAQALGGIAWGATATDLDIARPAADAALLLASAIGVMAREAPRSYRDGLRVTVATDSDGVAFELEGPPVSRMALLGPCRRIESGPLDTSGARFVVEDGRLRLWLRGAER